MTAKTKIRDFVIIGGGVIGVTIALEIRRRDPAAKILIIEKEPNCGFHASGRNSGVLHAGFYYTADSLKARFTRDGSRRMAAYCEARELTLNRCGKLVVAINENDLPVFDTLLDRAKSNNVRLQRISLQEAQEIEPRVKSAGDCLWSPDTVSVNPTEVMNCLVEDAISADIEIQNSCRFLERENDRLRTSCGTYQAGFVVNTAGLYADQVARQFGFCREYSIMPFKGLYLIAGNHNSVNTNIYPVPDISNPFLGVHYTVSSDGQVSIGPTAIPAFWREHYQGMSRFNAKELMHIVTQQMGLFMRNDFGFRDLAFQEIPKYLKRTMIGLAEELAQNVAIDNFDRWGPAGIRAQLVRHADHGLEMDFVYQGDQQSFHVLNAVSPAFTCSLELAEYFVDQFAINL